MSASSHQAPRAVLFDRDGTLVVDVPYNGDPSLVAAMPTAAVAVRMLREAGIPIGVVSNQSGVGRGILTEEQVWSVNRRVDELLGPFDVWEICPHVTSDGCECRKPRPGMILSAARQLGLDATEVAMIGDIGADMGAASAAGARSVLVPTEVTRIEEVRSATDVAPDLASAVSFLFATSGAFPRGAESGAAAPSKAESGGAVSGGAVSGGAVSGGAVSGGVSR